jgi:hypothetical protein
MYLQQIHVKGNESYKVSKTASENCVIPSFDTNRIQSTLIHRPTTSQWSRVLEKLTVAQLVKKFQAFHGIRKFITEFTEDPITVLYLLPSTPRTSV